MNDNLPIREFIDDEYMKLLDEDDDDDEDDDKEEEEEDSEESSSLDYISDEEESELEEPRGRVQTSFSKSEISLN